MILFRFQIVLRMQILNRNVKRNHFFADCLDAVIVVLVVFG